MERLLALRRVPHFARFSLDQLEAIARAMDEETFVAGEVVVREGEPGHELYLLLEGEVAIYGGWGTPRCVERNRLHAVSYFGEMAVLDDEPRSASVVVTQDARLAALNVGHVSYLLRVEYRFDRLQIVAAARSEAPQLCALGGALWQPAHSERRRQPAASSSPTGQLTPVPPRPQ